MEQIVEKKDKSAIKVFLVVIGFVVAIDFIMFFMRRYVKMFPYMSSLMPILLVIISCSYILIKYFSKYLYTLQGEQLIFYRIIGKRKFEMLRVDCSDLISIVPYDEKYKGDKYLYNFTFDKDKKGVYIGKFNGNNKETSFLFSPNESILKKLKGYKK